MRKLNEVTQEFDITTESGCSIKESTILIEQMNELTSRYIDLEDDLSNAGEFRHIEYKLEELALKYFCNQNNIKLESMEKFVDEYQEMNNKSN